MGLVAGAVVARGRRSCVSGLRMDRADEARRVTSEPLDASEPERLWLLFELSGSDCTAIITNTPHNMNEACAIVRNLVALMEGQRVELSLPVQGSGALSRGGCPFSTAPHTLSAASFVVGSPPGAKPCDRERAEADQRRRRPETFLGSDELSNEGRGAIHSSSPLARQEFGRTRGSKHA